MAETLLMLVAAFGAGVVIGGQAKKRRIARGLDRMLANGDLIAWRKRRPRT